MKCTKCSREMGTTYRMKVKCGMEFDIDVPSNYYVTLKEKNYVWLFEVKKIVKKR